MLSPVVLTLLCLATAGITRALVIEKPFAWWRNWVKKTWGDDSNVTYLVHCPFCTGFWVGTVLTFLTWQNNASDWWMTLLVPWAIFAVAPHIADR